MIDREDFAKISFPSYRPTIFISTMIDARAIHEIFFMVLGLKVSNYARLYVLTHKSYEGYFFLSMLREALRPLDQTLSKASLK